MNFHLLGVLVTLLTAAPPSAGASYLVGHDGRWWEVELPGGAVRPLAFPEGIAPKEAVLSNDGRRVAFTARKAEAQADLLYLWNRGDGSVRLLGDAHGHHAAPSFSADGKWVYFAHHPKAGGPPGAHEAKAYAQVYRVRVGGGNLEALTSEQGCHLAPVSSGDAVVLFIHTDCGRERVLRATRGRQGGQETRQQLGFLQHLALSPKGDFVAAIVESTDAVNVYEVETADVKLRPRLLLQAQKRQHAGEVWHGPHRGELLFLLGSRLLWVAEGQACQLADLGSAEEVDSSSPCTELSKATAALVSVSGVTQ